METTDKQFYLAFSGVLAALVLITILVAVVANVTGSRMPAEKSKAQIEKNRAYIQPVGRVNLASTPNPALSAVMLAEPAPESSDQAAPASAEDQGARVYKMVCMACHDSGVAGAPKIGDVSAWSVRLEAGIGALYNSGINGKGAIMPPKGGNPALSDEDVKAAVDYMLETSR